MAPKPNENVPEKISPFQVLILVLSVYVLLALAVQLVVQLPKPINSLLNGFDTLICFIFIGDFIYRLHRSKNKWQFLKWGWIDIISSIPTIDFLRWGRVLRIFRILRLLRAFKSTKTLIAYLFQNRSKSTLMIASLISLLLVMFSSIAILTFEDLPESHIKNPIDAAWWAFSTISTTGSGDAYPITTAGKVLSVLLAVCGIGLFGTFTAYVARVFLEPQQKQENDDLDDIKKQLVELHGKIDKFIASSADAEKGTKT